MKQKGWLLLVGLGLALPSRSQSFLVAGTYSVGQGGLRGATAIGDVNQDGRPDLLVLCNNAPPDAAGHLGPALAYAFGNWQSVGVLLQQANGTFAPVVRYSLGNRTSPGDLVVGDFNHDHYPDLAISDSGHDHGVLVLLNQGDGSFGTPAEYSTGALGLPRSLAVGDVNADGVPDLVAANSNRASVSVLLNQGHGIFALGPTCPTMGIPAIDVALSDTNQDGYPDLVVAGGGMFDSGVGVLLNQRDGTFAPISKYAIAASGAEAVAAGDVNHDGYPDLVVSCYQYSTGVLLNQRDGTFAPFQRWSLGRPMESGLAVADFNADGYADLALADAARYQAGILLSRPQGEAAALTLYDLGPGEGGGIAVGDLNHDGAPDVVGVANYSGVITVLLNQTAPATAIAPPALASAARPGQPQATIYPNPAPAAGPAPVLAVVQLPTAATALSIVLLTELGQPVSQLVALASQGTAYSKIPVAGLATGIYLLNVTALDNQSHVLAKLPTLRLSVP